MSDVETLSQAPGQPLEADGSHELDKRRVLVVIGALMLGMLLAALDQTVVATALPTIVGDLHDSAHIAWIVTAYLLLSTVSTPLWGKLGDLYGRKAFFQAAIVIFLLGSVLSGLSRSMLMLIAFRAVQGLGAGGLMVGAQAIVGDVVSPRDRGRYQGLFGAVFAVSTVVGPLLGGFLTQHASWRWVFYINVPLGIVALAVTAAVLPPHLHRVQHVIDYLGTALLTGAATALVLVASLGGTTYAWGSAPIIGLGVGGVVLAVVWALVERRAVEPVLPLHLFANRVFSISSAMGFVVGFALFGAVTFLPVFLQVAKGSDPTTSGLQLLPLMGGMLLTSITSGMLISRTGRYKVFPIVGSALMTVGMYLLSTISASTSSSVLFLYMVLVGLGMGGVMQVLVIAAQNSVPYKDLGVATAGATFFRSIGGSFGTAIFGAIFANVLVRRLTSGLHLRSAPKGLGEAVTPGKLAHLPPAVHHAVAGAYASTVDVVFLVAVPVVAVAFVLAWVLPEVRLRTGVRADKPESAAGVLLDGPATLDGAAALEGAATLSGALRAEGGTAAGNGSSTETPSAAGNGSGGGSAPVAGNGVPSPQRAG